MKILKQIKSILENISDKIDDINEESKCGNDYAWWQREAKLRAWAEERHENYDVDISTRAAAREVLQILRW